MIKKPYRRTHYLVDKKIQLTYTGMMIFYVVLISFIMGLAIWYVNNEYLEVFRRIGGENVFPQDYIQQIGNQFLIKLGLALVFIAVLLYFVGIYASNRFAGPLYRITKYLRLIGIENHLGKISIRKKDQLKELADAFNNMMGSLELKLTKDVESIDQLKLKISDMLLSLEKGVVNPDILLKEIKEMDELTSKLIANNKKK